MLTQCRNTKQISDGGDSSETPAANVRGDQRSDLRNDGLVRTYGGGLYTSHADLSRTIVFVPSVARRTVTAEGRRLPHHAG
jgi:hypothetical protein